MPLPLRTKPPTTNAGVISCWRDKPTSAFRVRLLILTSAERVVSLSASSRGAGIAVGLMTGRDVVMVSSIRQASFWPTALGPTPFGPTPTKPGEGKMADGVGALPSGTLGEVTERRPPKYTFLSTVVTTGTSTRRSTCWITFSFSRLMPAKTPATNTAVRVRRDRKAMAIFNFTPSV